MTDLKGIKKMYTIRSIRSDVSQKSGQVYYRVLCDDDYVSKYHMAGAPYKEVICSDKGIEDD